MLASSLQDVIALTEYAVEARYPGDLPDPDREEAKAPLGLAERERDAVKDSLASA